MRMHSRRRAYTTQPRTASAHTRMPTTRINKYIHEYLQNHIHTCSGITKIYMCYACSYIIVQYLYSTIQHIYEHRNTKAELL